MGSYKEDSDKFFEAMDQRQRDLAKAETWSKFVDLLEASGINVDEFVDTLTKVDGSLKRIGIPEDFRRELVVKAFHLRLGLEQEKSPRQD